MAQVQGWEGPGCRPLRGCDPGGVTRWPHLGPYPIRSEEHTSELQSPALISYAVFCLKKKNFFNDTATTEIYTLSLHDALPIWGRGAGP